jgi:transcriptional regulator with XRE-family HTH domain
MAKPYGETLRKERERLGLSQDELAKRAKVGRELVIRAEQSGNVGILLLCRIAHVLEIDVRIVGVDEPEKAPSVWSRLKREQRAEVLRYAYRLLGERVPAAEMP